MKKFRAIVSFVALCLLSLTCKDREPLNPLDPDNPSTRGKPYSLQAVATGIGKVRLHWQKVNQPQVRSYRVFRSIEGGAASHIVDATDTLFVDTQLQPGKAYSYFYRLIWEDGREIHESPTAGAFTFDAPTGFGVSNASRTRVELQWDDLHWLDNYALCRIFRASGSSFSLYDSTSVNQYADTHVDTGVTYRYKLMAVGTDGTQSNYSVESYATPGNRSPVIDSLKPSQPITGWGEQVSITCYAHDEDGDPITYSWQALDGGTIVGLGRAVAFQVPQDSVLTHRVTATVSDGYSTGNQDTAAIQSSDILLYEDFEDNMLDTRIKIQTTGTFNSPPGIKNNTNLGSNKAFGFGLSTCGASCFDSFVTGLIITVAGPTYVSRISFKEMELFGNWGSHGEIYLDGVPSGKTFGRSPVNDGQPDSDYRKWDFPIAKSVYIIELRVTDITSSSEILIDDLSLHR